jgi:TPR repeat protein
MEMFFRAGDHELSQFTLGVMLAKGQGRPVNLPLSTRFFQKASDKGNAKAMFNLGLAYLEGHGVPKDLNTAACWNMRAASKGLPDAQFQLGLCSLTGQGVEKSLEKATEWFRLAAEQGYGDAQFCLGRILFDQHSPEAMVWIIKAADNGNKYAAMVLEQVSSQFENVQTCQLALSASIGLDDAELLGAIKDLNLQDESEDLNV